MEEAFRSLIDAICQQARAEGLEILPYLDSSWEKFQKLGVEQQRAGLNAFLRYHEICCAGVEEGVPLRDGRALLRKLVRACGYRCDESFFDQVSQEDVLEIYDKRGIQVYRNTRFYELCSYPLLDLYTHEWQALYRRPAGIGEIVLEHARALCQDRGSPRTVRLPIQEHVVEEIFSPERRRFWVWPDLLASIKDENEKTVWIMVGKRVERLDGGEKSCDIRPLNS